MNSEFYLPRDDKLNQEEDFQKGKKRLRKTKESLYHRIELPTETTMLIAILVCPAVPNPASTRAFKVASMLASGIIIA